MGVKTYKLLITLPLLSACGGSAKKSPEMAGGDMKKMDAMDMKMGMAAPNAQSAAVLASAKDYASWPKFAEMPTTTLSEGHMNMFVLGYHNQVVTDAIASKTLPLPDGAIIVKQQMKAADAPPMSITVMSKQGGQWYWISATPDGQQVMTMNGMPLEGTDVAMCKDCHDGAQDNDFVLTHKFK